MQKVTPFLMFKNNTSEAFEYYTSVFKNSKIISLTKMGENGEMATGEIEIEGQRLLAFDGGEYFSFSEAFSFFVLCEDQSEVDYYWEKLLDGGKESQCGWLKDKFGLSWQIIPKKMQELMSDPDSKKAQRVMQAMMQMIKIDVAKLEEAYNNDN